MKKKLRLVLLSLPLLIAAIIVSIFLIRYRSAGDVLLTGVTTANEGVYLLRAREVGAQQVRLSRGESAHLTLSSNGRYAAFTCKKGDSSRETLLYDLTQPRKPLLRLQQSYPKALLPLDDGSLISLSNSRLYRNGEALADNIFSLGGLSADSTALYCLREVVEDRLDLCRISLSDGSLTTILENVRQSSLQLTQDAAGQDIIICAQKHLCEFTMYDLVHDSLAEADENATDEEAMKRNDLRERMRQESTRETVYTIYRITADKQEVLAEGVSHDFFCDPLTGIVVHRLGRLFQQKVDIATLRDKYVPLDHTWYCTVDGTRTPLLRTTIPAAEISVQFSGDGAMLAHWSSYSYERLWHLKDGVPVEANLVNGIQSAHFLRNMDGEMQLYYKTFDGMLYCHDGEENRLIRENIWSAYLPCRILPDGTRQIVDDRIYVIADAGASDMEDIRYWWPNNSTLLLMQNGKETVLANISNSSPSLIAALPDGSVLMESGPLYIVGENRTDRLFSRIPAPAWWDALFVGTELVTLN